MNTNAMELNMEEMENVNGGFSIEEFMAKVVLWHIVHSNDEYSGGGCDLVHLA